MEFSQEISFLQYSPACTTEEDDDMAANCLILLAQSDGSPNRKQGTRKFSEMADTTASAGAPKVAAGGGVYVYGCKTCNRTFPSFQALGGHRASHKKPKLMDNQTASPASATVFKKQSTPPPRPPLSLAEASNGSQKAKIHECSICSAEFSSGQALGGHMRRHRPVPAISAAVKETAAEVSSSGNDGGGDMKTGVGFSIDLNLPAPQEEDEEANGNNGNNKFEFSPKQQSLVFSAPPLVDCHY
ncbi:unnamed protein product [Cuscuta europaea]|uniref:C2H2-type domain-containing protein n=1 Tax=Cuscuta europaea TaxID=41803 RepID=A0A9P0YRE7_CUSEU|nr:unnamed protein product [Cuscuta europaea]